MLRLVAPAAWASACAGLLLVVSSPVSSCRAGESGPIPWRTALPPALVEAKASGRPIWLQFTGPWCSYCMLMERDVFVRPEVAGPARDRFIPVRLSADQHAELAHQLGVSGLPATLILAPSGATIARHEGYLDAPAFRGFLDQAAARLGPPSGVSASDPLALAGSCPVTLVRRGLLLAGQPALALRHEGREYRFVDEPARAAFRRTPEAFLPVADGRCPVGQADRGESRVGEPRFGVVYGGRLFLCTDEPARDRFVSNPDRYVSAPAFGLLQAARPRADRAVR